MAAATTLFDLYEERTLSLLSAMGCYHMWTNLLRDFVQEEPSILPKIRVGSSTEVLEMTRVWTNCIRYIHQSNDFALNPVETQLPMFPVVAQICSKYWGDQFHLLTYVSRRDPTILCATLAKRSEGRLKTNAHQFQALVSEEYEKYRLDVQQQLEAHRVMLLEAVTKYTELDPLEREDIVGARARKHLVRRLQGYVKQARLFVLPTLWTDESMFHKMVERAKPKANMNDHDTAVLIELFDQV